MSKQNTKPPTAPLRLAKGLRFKIGSDGNTYASISSSSGEFYISQEVLSILCLLADKNRVTSVRSIPSLLKKHYQSTLANLPQEEESEALIDDLIGAGLLLRGDGNQEKHMQADGFGDPWAQWTMLSDKKRSDSYYAALKSVINSSSVVLDVGAGTGFLSAISLHCGAKKVIAIEETKAADSIKPIFKQLHLPINDTNFTLYNSNSFDVEWNENVTTVVSELFGNDPFQEGIIPTLRDIGSRFIDKKVTYIPQKVTVFFEIVDLHSHPALHRINAFHTIYEKKEEKKDAFTNLFLESAAKKLDLDDISFSLALTANDFIRTTKPLNIGETRLDPPPVFSSDHKKHPFYGKNTLTIDKNCDNAIALIWFQVELVKGITISSLPSENDACAHWSPIAIPLKKTLKKNDKIEIKYQLSEEENYIHCNIFHNNEKIGSR